MKKMFAILFLTGLIVTLTFGFADARVRHGRPNYSWWFLDDNNIPGWFDDRGFNGGVTNSRYRTATPFTGTREFSHTIPNPDYTGYRKSNRCW